ncbi:MAG: hypothetical protein J6U42_02320 [Lachnospiraceae bacterium]|nr:hypothetical protein [Lachnospiraceae bacterium]
MSQNKTKSEQGFPVIPAVIVFFMVLFALAAGNKYLHDDLGVVLKWWFMIFCGGVAFFPLAHVIGHRFKDGGYVLAKGLGLALGSWVVWTLSTFRILKFTNTGTVITLAVCAILSYGIYISVCTKNKQRAFEEIDMTKFAHMLYFEALFLLMFIGACYFRSFRVTIDAQTEKDMDFGFLASVLNAEYLPAEDMWFAGKPINYYYYGIYVCGYVARLVNTNAGYAYNLGFMMLAALGFVQVYQLVYELMFHAADEHDKRMKVKDPSKEPTGNIKRYVLSHIAGWLSGFAVFAAGNMQYVLYCYVIPWIQKIIGMEPKSYWFPDATRFITDEYEGVTGTLIHEFPSYSFVLGDLHAHVTDIIFVFTIVPVLFALLLNRKDRMEKARDNGVIEKADYLKEALLPEILTASFLIGIMKTANYWDFFIYFVVSGGVILFSNAIITGFKKEALIMTAIHAAECLVLSVIVAIPFNINFESPSAGVGLCYTHSSPYELAVLWALPISVSVGLFVTAIKNYSGRFKTVAVKKQKKGSVIKADPNEADYIYTSGKGEKKVNHLFSFIYRLEFSDLFVLTIAACAMGLVLVPEIVYVRDIYGGSYARTNTMFKLAYQAFMLFGLVMSYGIVRFIGLFETKKQLVLSLIAAFFLCWTFGYFGKAAKSYTGDITKPDDYADRTLNSYNVMTKCEHTDQAEADAVNWINENLEPDAVILQMGTLSYRAFSIISSWTGRPTVCGWAYHEWLWRNGGTLQYPDCVKERANFTGGDVVTLYTSTDREEVERLIEKYDIDYIYVGITETVNGYDQGNKDSGDDFAYVKGVWARKTNLDHEFLKSLGSVVYNAGTREYQAYCYDTGEWVTYSYPNYIVKVNR